MKKVTMLSAAISLLFCMAASVSSAYEPTKRFPVETVCKEDRSDMPFLTGFVIVSESYHFSCSGGGKNAWQVKVLEPGDTICGDYYAYALGGGYAPFSLEAYKVIGEKMVNYCASDESGNPISTKAITLDVRKDVLNPAPTHLSYRPYFGFKRLSDSTHLLKEASEKVEYMCATSPQIPTGYWQQGENFYREECNPDKTTPPPIHGMRLIAPDDFATDIYWNGASVPTNQPNYMVTRLYSYVQYLTMFDIKRARDAIEQSCLYDSYVIPFGYLVTSEIRTSDCVVPDREDTPYPNTLRLKKIGDFEEIVCMNRSAGNYDAFGNGYSLPARIPDGYSIVGEFYKTDCFHNQGNTSPNAYKLQKK